MGPTRPLPVPLPLSPSSACPLCPTAIAPMRPSRSAVLGRARPGSYAPRWPLTSPRQKLPPSLLPLPPLSPLVTDTINSVNGASGPLPLPPCLFLSPSLFIKPTPSPWNWPPCHRARPSLSPHSLLSLPRSYAPTRATAVIPRPRSSPELLPDRALLGCALTADRAPARRGRSPSVLRFHHCARTLEQG
jgi:hypothetical protein